MKAEELLRAENVEFHVRILDRDSEELNEAKQRNNWRTVPMVTHVEVSDGVSSSKFIGGYTDLESFVESRKNEEN